jgi:hypothetical protein
MNIQWPDGKQFAFTAFDDTDCATLGNVSEVYRLLADLGLRTTKSVWPLAGEHESSYRGQTCEDKEYLDWLMQLRQEGFEIGFHMATWHTSERKRTLAALNRFEQLFGHPPAVMANHADCRENIYWGATRFNGVARLVYNMLTGFRFAQRYRGHVEEDRLFWGDLCQEKIRYCRNFVFENINTLAECPYMPYHDPQRSYVNYWFSSSDGGDLPMFNRCLGEANQDRLAAHSGACIMYTHFAMGFAESGKLNPAFKALMQRLANMNGWFVPVSTLLDYLREKNRGSQITSRQRSLLAWKWLFRKARSRRPEAGACVMGAIDSSTQGSSPFNDLLQWVEIDSIGGGIGDTFTPIWCWFVGGIQQAGSFTLETGTELLATFIF